jgi:hypothetical protein
VKYNCALIKVDWLAACLALRVVGTVLVVFLRSCHEICTILPLCKINGAPKK